MTIVDWATVLLIVAPTFPALASIILVRHWSVASTSLHERALLAVRDWVVASIAALLALTRLGFVTLPNGSAVGLLIVAMLLVSLPSAYWLYLYWRGSFR